MNDRNLPLIPTLVFLGILISGILIYIVSIDQLAPPVVSQLLTDSDGEIRAVVKNQIVRITGPSSNTNDDLLSLQKHGIKNHIGLLVPMKNGEWIVNRGGQSRSLTTMIRRYFRTADPDPVSEATGDLLHCTASFESCRPWGSSQFKFETAWNGIELTDGRFLISDTSRHQIHLTDNQGKILDTLGDFRFPNDIKAGNHKYWITDTNHNALVELVIIQNKLVKTGAELNLSLFPEISKEHRFPVSAEFLNGDWWIITNTIDMGAGGIYRLNTNLQNSKRFAKNHVSPIDIIEHNDAIYFSEFDAQSIFKLNQESGKTREVNSPDLTKAFKHVTDNLNQDKFYYFSIYAVLGLISILFLIFSIKTSKPVNKGYISDHESKYDFLNKQNHPPYQSDKIIWIPLDTAYIKSLKKTVDMFYAGIFFFAASIFLMDFLLWSKPETQTIVSLKLILVFMLVIILPILFLVSKREFQLLNKKIGVAKGELILYENSISQHTSPGKQVPYCLTGMFIGKKNLAIEANSQPIFHVGAFNRYIVPSLKLKNKRTQFEQFTYRLSEMDRELWLKVTFTVIVLLGILLLKTL